MVVVDNVPIRHSVAAGADLTKNENMTTVEYLQRTCEVIDERIESVDNQIKNLR